MLLLEGGSYLTGKKKRKRKSREKKMRTTATKRSKWHYNYVKFKLMGLRGINVF